MEWKIYKGRDPQNTPEGYEPTMLEEGKRYLLFTDKGETKFKPWYYIGGFRTEKRDPRTCYREVWNGKECFWVFCDANVLYYCETTAPKGFVNEHKIAEIKKLEEKIAKMNKKLKALKND